MIHTAHPRVCGENLDFPGFVQENGGSSPRVRGKPTRRRTAPFIIRLIPACAGKTMCLSLERDAKTAHPRVCGENPHASSHFFLAAGSSPRVRGKRCLERHRCLSHWLIPACAGKTWPRAATSDSASAHPRVCGENDRGGPSLVWVVGSSPRVRGKPGGGVGRGLGGRLIPACAGKTSTTVTPRTTATAHPRVCGENGMRAVPIGDGSGSSPRVRGKRGTAVPAPSEPRLIPACAGKTTPSS